NPRSVLSLSGTRLALANDLALLPVPFFDSASHHTSSVPVVFSGRPDMDALEAASVVASWFGIFSDFRGARFPVTVGELPTGNAVVLALCNSELAASLSLPPRTGPLLAVRDDPRDTYGKSLLLAATRTEDLLLAACALGPCNSASSPPLATYFRACNVAPRSG